MATAVEQNIRLAQNLHPRLLRLFKRFPPPQLAATPSALPSESESSLTDTTTDAPPNANGRKTNPFLPFKNLRTGNWHGPHYGLRRQAELFKLAKEYNVMPLMPLSPKHPDVKAQKRIENGLRMKGTGVGQKVKGHAWERTMRGRLEMRRQAMLAMPAMIREWKQRGHGRFWKKWPK